ncbi:hypothetical protein ES703_125009 [subsurface metagenome]
MNIPVFLEANAISCSKNPVSCSEMIRESESSLGKVTTKIVTIAVTKVTPQSKKKKEYKKHNSVKSVNSVNALVLLIPFKPFK